MATQAQRERQRFRNDQNGKYTKVNACYRCGRSAGVDYFSFMADEIDEHGNSWGDKALCVCAACGSYLESIPVALAWTEATSPKWGKLPKGRA